MTAFDPERFRHLLAESPGAFGNRLVFQPITGSSNDDALAAARHGAIHGSVFVTDEQTKGRGRRGHVWLAAPAESLLFSLLLRPRLELHQVSALTLVVGLALRDALAPFIAEEVCIKWPNDVLVGDKKLAGVLVESQLQGELLRAVVVGVGLNVSTRAFPVEIAGRATSLALLGATTLERELILCHVLRALGRRLDEYERAGVQGLLAELRAADALYGRRVRVDERAGIAMGFDEQGRLLLDADGHLHAVLSGTVELS